MRRSVFVLMVVPTVVVAIACAPTYGVEEGAGSLEAGVSDAGLSDAGASAAEAGVDAGCAAPATETFLATADTTLVSAVSREPPERFGAAPTLTLRTGSIGLFRFALGAKASAAITSGTASRIAILLTPVSAAEAACDGGACAYTAGTLVLYPVRNDWEEGSGDDFSGASFELRTSPAPKIPWATPGADGVTDRGIAAGSASLPPDVPPGIAIDVGPEVLADRRFATWVAGSELSVRVGPATSVVTVHAREAPSSVQRPRLLVTYCPR